MANCKYCGMGGLEWEQTLNQKWILLDAAGQKHFCVKPKAPGANKVKDFKNDPKINKALKEFKKKLDENKGKKVYYLK